VARSAGGNSTGSREDLVDTLTRGNPLEVKTVLASVAFALAAYGDRPDHLGADVNRPGT
jgi:hypothetical protein